MRARTYPDRSASFYIKAEYGPDHPDRRAGQRSPGCSTIAGRADLPGFRETCLEYYEAMTGALPQDAAAASGGARPAADCFADARRVQSGGNTLRLLHYPPRDRGERGPVRHRPAYRLRLLHLSGAGEEAGLEILTRERRMDPGAGARGHFLVNNADHVAALDQRPLALGAASRDQRDRRDALLDPVLLRHALGREARLPAELPERRTTRRNMRRSPSANTWPSSSPRSTTPSTSDFFDRGRRPPVRACADRGAGGRADARLPA